MAWAKDPFGIAVVAWFLELFFGKFENLFLQKLFSVGIKL